MPLAMPLPGLVEQQKADPSPQDPQACVTSLVESLPWPTTVMYQLQPGQRCLMPGMTCLMWPFSRVTVSTTTDLHLAQTIAMVSSGFKASAWAKVLLPCIWSERCIPLKFRAGLNRAGRQQSECQRNRRPETKADITKDLVFCFHYRVFPAFVEFLFAVVKGAFACFPDSAA